ncbi:MAG: hypothetical protein FJW20_10170 [Acidimicrobiia bacterium]|nr:hypothetical protein [Acidimicrobiia bacterium]
MAVGLGKTAGQGGGCGGACALGLKLQGTARGERGDENAIGIDNAQIAAHGCDLDAVRFPDFNASDRVVIVADHPQGAGFHAESAGVADFAAAAFQHEAVTIDFALGVGAQLHLHAASKLKLPGVLARLNGRTFK